ncbi:MAG TPA: hypothetical protein VK524_28020 [Polyangiaceae bacterium]|nr:hypothetical protein [Polyangiaceae bacterium]
MARTPETIEAPGSAAARTALDPELSALPRPRRPGRTLTLAAMLLTVVAACFMSFALRGEALYALQSGPPTRLGNLSFFDPAHAKPNTWVQGEAALAHAGAVRYQRPLEGDSYRLARVADSAHLWVQVRVPSEMEGPHFVPPNSFVGRLVPVAEAGLRYRGLGESAGMAANAWLLIDGEAPQSTRWSLGLLALFAGFAAFNVYGLFRLLRPIRDG